MVLGDSNVILDKNIKIETPREFFPTLAEKNAEIEPLIKKRLSTGNIYTVPPNKTLFITSAFLTGMETANASTHGFLTITINQSGFGSESIILAIAIDHIVGQHSASQATSISFPMPLRLDTPAIIDITMSGMTTPAVVGGFTGFLVSKKIS